jgi:hypothetical protein
MNLKTAMRIAALKAKARRLYLEIHQRSNALDCGAHLARVVSPGISRAERQFQETMATLASIDPDAQALVERYGGAPM